MRQNKLPSLGDGRRGAGSEPGSGGEDGETRAFGGSFWTSDAEAPSTLPGDVTACSTSLLDKRVLVEPVERSGLRVAFRASNSKFPENAGALERLGARSPRLQGVGRGVYMRP